MPFACCTGHCSCVGPPCELSSVTWASAYIVHPCRDKYRGRAPSLLGATWLALRGSDSALLGATTENGCTDFFDPPTEAEGAQAEHQLRGAAHKLLPSLASWRTVAVRWGIRALSKRSKYGKLPVVARLDEGVWFFGALGSRGLIYHSWLAERVARAVLEADESHIPEEFRPKRTAQ